MGRPKGRKDSVPRKPYKKQVHALSPEMEAQVQRNRALHQSWEDWIASEEGQRVLDGACHPMSPATPDYRTYRQNCLWWAFQAGIAAADKFPEPQKPTT